MMATSSDSLREETVLEKTGKSRAEWHAILDAFGCKEKGHKESANYLHDEFKISFWWAQSLTVDYERAKGIREIGQRSGGKFAVNVTKTIAAPAAKVWEAWADQGLVSKWFTSEHRHEFIEGGGYKNADGDRGVYKRIVPYERIQFTWENEKHCPGTLVIVQFTPKGEKTAVAITHEKIADKKGSEDMKEGWNWALTSLKSFLEGGAPIGFDEWKKSQA